MARYGYKCKLFYGAEGTAELKIIGDVTINDSRTDIDVSSRLTNGFKSHVGGMRELSIEINMEHLPDDAGFKAVRNAYLNNTPIHFKSDDGDDYAAIDNDFTILEFPQAEPLDDKLSHAIKASLYVKESETSAEASETSAGA